jgi:uncharacterized delta-60 repeat protein
MTKQFTRVTLCSLLAVVLWGCGQPPIVEPPIPLPPFTESFLGAAAFVGSEVLQPDLYSPTLLQADGGSISLVLSDDPTTPASRATRLWLARVDKNGIVDPQYSETQFVPMSDPVLMDVVEQSDARIVVSLSVNNPSGGYQRLIRFNADGSPDSTFGNAGVIELNDILVFPSTGVNLLVLSDDRIVVTGMGQGGAFRMARLTANGVPEQGFGENGRVSVKVPTTENAGTYATSVIELSDGAILVGGYVASATFGLPMLVKLLPDGKLDATFSEDGMLLTDVPGVVQPVVTQVAALEGGDFVLVGTAYAGPNGAHFAQRVSATGVLRQTFGTNGTHLKVGRGFTGPARVAVNSSRMALLASTETPTDWRLQLLTLNGILVKEAMLGADSGSRFVNLEPFALEAETLQLVATRLVGSSTILQLGTLRVAPRVTTTANLASR